MWNIFQHLLQLTYSIQQNNFLGLISEKKKYERKGQSISEITLNIKMNVFIQMQFQDSDHCKCAGWCWCVQFMCWNVLEESGCLIGNITNISDCDSEWRRWAVGGLLLGGQRPLSCSCARLTPTQPPRSHYTVNQQIKQTNKPIYQFITIPQQTKTYFTRQMSDLKQF